MFLVHTSLLKKEPVKCSRIGRNTPDTVFLIVRFLPVKFCYLLITPSTHGFFKEMQYYLLCNLTW